MASKLKELVHGKTLFSDWDLSKHLLHNMWNYSDVSEPFTNRFRDAGVFETLQDILRDINIRNSIEQDEVIMGHILYGYGFVILRNVHVWNSIEKGEVIIGKMLYD